MKKNNSIIKYESLCTTEAENLAKACKEVIIGKKVESENIFKKLFKELCYCGSSFPTDTSLNECVFSILFYLEKNVWNCDKMFIKSGIDKEADLFLKLLEEDGTIDYSEADPLSVATGFKRYAQKYIKNIIPTDVSRELIRAYKENDKEAKKKIIPRIPFVMNDIQRQFMILLIKIFNAIEEHAKKTDSDVNDVYNIFAPIIIRRPSDMLDTTTFCLRSAFIDIIKAEFNEFPMSYYES